ncbi:signal transduction histidine kinase [Pedobacter cryoconitis]|uniref:histidine kinase n=1 Tax=Pedobacter cryoconitis TaxID=188932 RepID=A0A7W9DIS1_9SPHI|nr:HAMP domain-containing sensor histidine kinase [Pedobacter cryoconitis]MBB5620422.1 signal transduction histidine kinase [Pedobacter cryoconitis]
MKVKNRLSLQFTFMFAILLLVVLTGIYLLVEHNRLKSFMNKLDERAVTVAQFYLAEDNLSKDIFRQVAKKFPQSLTHESIRVYDDKFNSKFTREDSISWKHEFLAQIVKKKSIHLRQGETQITGIYYPDNSGNFIVVVSAVDDRGLHDMEQLRLIMTAFFISSLFITFFIGRIFARISLQPIVSITDNLKRIRASSLHHRLSVNQAKTDETDNLSSAINQLLEHLEQSFESQKSFVANASHELRTPITSILGEAEITLMKERSPEEYKHALQEIVGSVERLNYIINSLMELMQTNLDNKDFQSIRIDELIWEIADELAFKTNTDPIKIVYDLPTDQSKRTLQGNRQLLFIAINNILKNAVKFSVGQEVLCTVGYKNQQMVIAIKDVGIGISPADIKKIFQPFYRSANALNFSGYGIGLSLTNNIVKQHNGAIQVESVLGQGTTFYVYLPIN